MNFSRYSGSHMPCTLHSSQIRYICFPICCSSVIQSNIFLACCPVDRRELNHIASFVSANLESFEVHAIPEVYKNVSFSVLRNTEMRNIALNSVQHRYRMYSIPV